MIDFHRLSPDRKEQYYSMIMTAPERGCEYSFANLYLWGKQLVAFEHGCALFFSHLNGKSVYPFPIGTGDKRAAVEAILHDAKKRGIPCRITGMTNADRENLESWFPGKFHLRTIRDTFDYVYDINDLADLKGKKFQKKRNHFNRFRSEHPDYQVLPINVCNLAMAQHMVNEWYRIRMKEDPEGDYLLENIAMARTFQNYSWLDMEGIMLVDNGEVLAVTMGSRLQDNTFDIHYEKAREDVDGAYNAVNCEFARYLRLQHPQVQFLNREDDLGLEGLRKAKLSYNPHHMVEKHWAYLLEDIDEN